MSDKERNKRFVVHKDEMTPVMKLTDEEIKEYLKTGKLSDEVLNKLRKKDN